MLSSAPVLNENLVGNIWIISSVIGGLVFVGIGARAGGLALLGAVVGGIIGFLLVSSDFDQLAKGATVGATVGTFVGGLVGLAWKPSATAVVLRTLGSVTILLGVLTVLAGRLVSERPHRPRWRYSRFPDIDGGSLALFAIDAAWVAAMCFIQAALSKPTDGIEHAPVGRPDVADAPSR
jgi:hypothetical protein